MTSVIPGRLAALDAALVAHGFPAITEWWQNTLSLFYASGVRQLVLRCGRRGGKSSTLCRLAVCEALYGSHVIPPGDVGVVGIVSVRREEATERLRLIRAILDTLGVQYRPLDAGIELLHKPVVFRVYTASVSGVVGGTWICAICDEVARWRDSDTGANPATEVLASLRPTLAGQPHARLFLSSSPMGKLDAHATAFDLGDTVFQRTAWAPTWVCRPALTQAMCHELEPHDATFSREYGAIPGSGEAGAFDPRDIEVLARDIHADSVGLDTGCMILDSSSGRADGFAGAICQYIEEPSGEPVQLMEVRTAVDAWGMTRQVLARRLDADGAPISNPKYHEPRSVLRFSEWHVFEGAFGSSLPFATVVSHFAGVAKRWGIRRIFGDQHLGFALASEFTRHGLLFIEKPWTAPAKVEAVSTARRLMRERGIVVEPGPQAEALKRELHAVREVFTLAGTQTIQAQRTSAGHADRASVFMLGARLESEGEIRGSPIQKRANTRTVYDPYNNETS